MAIPFVYRYLYQKCRAECDGNLCIHPAKVRGILHHTMLGLDYDHLMLVVQELKEYGFIARVTPKSIVFADVQWEEEQ